MEFIDSSEVKASLFETAVFSDTAFNAYQAERNETGTIDDKVADRFVAALQNRWPKDKRSLTAEEIARQWKKLSGNPENVVICALRAHERACRCLPQREKRKAAALREIDMEVEGTPAKKLATEADLDRGLVDFLVSSKDWDNLAALVIELNEDQRSALQDHLTKSNSLTDPRLQNIYQQLRVDRKQQLLTEGKSDATSKKQRKNQNDPYDLINDLVGEKQWGTLCEIYNSLSSEQREALKQCIDGLGNIQDPVFSKLQARICPSGGRLPDAMEQEAMRDLDEEVFLGLYAEESENEEFLKELGAAVPPRQIDNESYSINERDGALESEGIGQLVRDCQWGKVYNVMIQRVEAGGSVKDYCTQFTDQLRCGSGNPDEFIKLIDWLKERYDLEPDHKAFVDMCRIIEIRHHHERCMGEEMRLIYLPPLVEQCIKSLKKDGRSKQQTSFLNGLEDWCKDNKSGPGFDAVVERLLNFDRNIRDDSDEV